CHLHLPLRSFLARASPTQCRLLQLPQSLHLVRVLDAEEVEAEGERAVGDVREAQAAGAGWGFALQDRAVLEEAAESCGQVVQVAGEVVGLELAGDWVH